MHFLITSHVEECGYVIFLCLLLLYKLQLVVQIVVIVFSLSVYHLLSCFDCDFVTSLFENMKKLFTIHQAS